MELAYEHPHAMTAEEARHVIERIGESRMFIDLFGGSGIVSKIAMDSGKFKEVIYCDKRKWVEIEGVECFYTDYRDVLPFADGKTVIFADPPFLGLSGSDGWGKKEHKRLIDRLVDTGAKAYLLNSVFVEKIDDRIERVEKWNFRQEDKEMRFVWLYTVNSENDKLLQDNKKEGQVRSRLMPPSVRNDEACVSRAGGVGRGCPLKSDQNEIDRPPLSVSRREIF